MMNKEEQEFWDALNDTEVKRLKAVLDTAITMYNIPQYLPFDIAVKDYPSSQHLTTYKNHTINWITNEEYEVLNEVLESM